MDYGFGAVFGCPAHDQRDLDFAKKYNLKITSVVYPELDDDVPLILKIKPVLDQVICIQLFNGLKCPDESINKTIEHLEKEKLGVRKINFRLKDVCLDKDIGVVRYL